MILKRNVKFLPNKIRKKGLLLSNPSFFRHHSLFQSTIHLSQPHPRSNILFPLSYLLVFVFSRSIHHFLCVLPMLHTKILSDPFPIFSQSPLSSSKSASKFTFKSISDFSNLFSPLYIGSYSSYYYNWFFGFLGHYVVVDVDFQDSRFF